MRPSARIPRRPALLAVLAVVVFSLAVSSGAAARACDTPVYRYAMYNWVPEPYRIFYFYRDEVPGEDQKVNQMLSELAEDETAPVNVLLFRIDVAKEDALAALQCALSMSLFPIDITRESALAPIPQLVIDAWKTYDNGAAPAHVVMNPRGGKIFAGRLDPTTLNAMVASPARKKLGELFDQGHGMVLILLEGPKEAENRRAEKLVKKIIADAAAGKVVPPIDFGPPMPPPPEGQAGDEDQQHKPDGLDIGLLKVAQKDQTEKWLVRSLMTVEPDLDEYAEETMVFAIFGRGLALPPCLGEGINEQNLVGDLRFLSGPCSCTIKYQNPGVDLLLAWDWNTTADKMAEASGDFEDDWDTYQEFSPQAVGSLVSSTPEEKLEDDTPVVDGVSRTSLIGESGQPGDSPGQPEPSPETAVADASSRQASDPNTPVPAEQPTQGTRAEQPPADPQAREPSLPGDPTAGAEIAKRAEAGPDAERAGQAQIENPSPDAAPAASEEADSFATRQAWKLGVGIGLAAIVVFLVGVFLFRRASGGY